jgi:glycosyltransferase involved in cell wall biosynthesis
MTIASPIRVCFVAPKSWPLFNPACKEVIGGAEVDIYFLATELAKDKQFEISCIVADYGQGDIEHRNNVKIIKGVDFKANAALAAAKLWRAMKTADSHIYFQKTASWGTFFVALFCKFHKRLFMYRTATAGECDGTWPKNYFERKVFLRSLRIAAGVITQNKIDMQNLEQTTGIHSIAIPNAHPLSALCNIEKDTILWAGRSTPLKRPELFVDIARQVPNEHFTMICQRATEDKNYESLVDQAKKVKNLQFIHRVSFSEIDNYFQKAKIFINTSDSEGFPNTFIQACNFATPILSLNVNPDGFLNEYGCGISCNGNMQQMIDSIGFMLTDNRYIEMGKKARKYVEQKHDLKIIIEEYKRMFNALLHRGRSV